MAYKSYSLYTHGVYWGYNPLTNLLITNFLEHPSTPSKKQQWLHTSCEIVQEVQAREGLRC